MFQLRQEGLAVNAAIVSLLTLTLCIVALMANAGAHEAPRDSRSLIKPLIFKTPTVRAQNSNRVKVSGHRKRRTRRTRASLAAKQSAARRTAAAATRVVAKPREVQGVVVDSRDNMPTNAAEPSPAATTKPRPKGPISGGVLNGRAISMPIPPYPPIARAANAGGTVVVQVLIDEDGKVTEAHAISGHPLLQKAAEEAAWSARFAPTQLSGQPVKVTGVITYNFVP